LPADLEPLGEEQVEGFIQRLDWMHQELVLLAGLLSEAQMEEKPLKGRP